MILREDLPVGFALAQAVHAAGESAALRHPGPDTFAIVLGVPGETELLALHERLAPLGGVVLFREPDPPWLGAATAIGISPRQCGELRGLLRGLRPHSGGTR